MHEGMIVCRERDVGTLMRRVLSMKALDMFDVSERDGRVQFMRPGHIDQFFSVELDDDDEGAMDLREDMREGNLGSDGIRIAADPVAAILLEWTAGASYMVDRVLREILADVEALVDFPEFNVMVLSGDLLSGAVPNPSVARPGAFGVNARAWTGPPGRITEQ